VNPPTSLKNWSEWRRKATASTDISNKEAYFANDQYYEVKLATENIVNPMLSRDDMTTLRYNGETYFLVRIILHKAVWVEKEDGERRSTPPQISLVFGYIDREKQQNKTFHMINHNTGNEHLIDKIYKYT